MTEEKINQEFILKKRDKTRYYFLEQIKQYELISKKDKKICKILNYTEDLLILASKVTVCVSSYPFAYLAGIPVDITFCSNNKVLCNKCRN